ncbi:MAG TPA: hypothetical protein QGG18_09575 [Rhodospirillales bacterium]|nr:hypothetical protein [Rhodospirillales bacterium]
MSRIGKNLKDIFVLTPYSGNDSFDLGNHDADKRWRDEKLMKYPEKAIFQTSNGGW